jgi:TatD DNase family protein
MQFIDAHNHLQKLPPASVAGVLENSRMAGVIAMAVNATGPDDWDAVEHLSIAHGGIIIPCFGVHPWCTDWLGPDWRKDLRSRLEKRPSCVGEIGLDKAHDGTDLTVQYKIFTQQLEIAAELERPAVIHCVRSWGPLMQALQAKRPRRFMLHAYTGAAELIPVLARLGGYFSFTGELENAGRVRLRKALAAAPRDRLLFETESPAQDTVNAPWGAGPQCMAKVVTTAAAILNMRAEDLAETTRSNSFNFFGDALPQLP